MPNNQEKVSVLYQLKDEASAGIQKLDSSFVSLAKSMLSPKAILVALSAAAIKSVSSFAELETKMRNVGNLTLASSGEVRGMTNELMELSKTVPSSAGDLADSLFDVVSAGIPASESIEFLGAASKLAAAGVTTTKVAVDGLTTVINAYGLEASDATLISDKFFGAQQAGKTTIEELATNIGKVAPLAKNMGISIDEVLASVSALTLQGIKTNEAVTGVRAALSGIGGPSVEAKKLANELGIEFSEAALKAKGLEQFMRDVIDATGGNTNAMKVLFGSIEAVNSVVSLSSNNFESLSRVQDQVASSADVTAKAYQYQGETVAQTWQLTMNRLNSFVVWVGSMLAPAVNASLKVFNKLYDVTAKISRFLLVVNSNYEKNKKASKEAAEAQVSDSEKIRIAKLKEKNSQVQNLIDLKNAEADTLKKIMALHTKRVEGMKLNNEYTLENEIALYDQILETHELTINNRIAFENKRAAIETSLREQKTKKAIAIQLKENQRLKALGKLSLEGEIQRIEELMSRTDLSYQQREALASKLFDLETDLMVQKNENSKFYFSEEQKRQNEILKMKEKGVSMEMQFNKLVLDASREAGDKQLSLEKQVANGVLDILKQQIIAKVDAIAAEYVVKGTALLVSSFGFNPKGWANLAAGAAMSSAIRSAMSGIKLANGGIVLPTPGGTTATIGEAGQAEAVIPLGSRESKEMLGGGNNEDKVIILDSDGMTMLAKGVYRKQKYLERTGQLGNGLK